MSQADVDQLEDYANDAVEIGTNVASFGTFSYRPDTGQVKQGFIVRGIDEGIGELTGRNALRESLASQREALREANKAQEKMIEDERNRRFRQERGASNYAATVRSRIEQRARQALGGSSNGPDMLGA